MDSQARFVTIIIITVELKKSISMHKTFCCVIISSGPIESLMYRARYIVAQGLRRAWASMFTSFSSVQFSHSVMSDSLTPWTVALQASLSITNSQSLLRLMSIKSVMPSNHPLSSRSSPAFSCSQHQGLSQWVGSSNQVDKILELQLQHQSLQWIFRIDFL